jgi:AraC-like DNA-binding protein
LCDKIEHDNFLDTPSGCLATDGARREVTMEPEIGQPRGILNPKAGEKRFQLSRHLPAPDLSFFVEFYWIVSWDLRGQGPYVQETLPHPCVHLVFEKGQSRVFGVITGKFSRLLENEGRVFSVKFKPGAFYPFVKMPVSTFTDTTISLSDAFGGESNALEEAIFACENEEEMTKIAETFLRERHPERDEYVAKINQIVDYIIAHPELTRVDELVGSFDLNKRTLQRLFNQYVGVSPKWVIKRYRLHEVAERLANGEDVDWASMALDLEYFDQAHFIKDFKAIVGKTPAEYARNI